MICQYLFRKIFAIRAECFHGSVCISAPGQKSTSGGHHPLSRARTSEFSSISFSQIYIQNSANSSFGDKVSGGTFDVEDLAMGFIKFDNGACLQIEFSWASNIEKERTFVELLGTKAGASWPNLKIFTEEYGSTVDVVPAISTKDFNGHKLNLIHFVDVLQGRAEPAFVPQQGVNMIGILTAMYESAKKGCEVRL